MNRDWYVAVVLDCVDLANCDQGGLSVRMMCDLCWRMSWKYWASAHATSFLGCEFEFLSSEPVLLFHEHISYAIINSWCTPPKLRTYILAFVRIVFIAYDN